MPNALQSRLNDLASSFASAVLDAIRGSSLRELHSAGGGGADGARRAREPATTGAAPRPARPRTSGRLARRSPEDIAGALDKVVALVKRSKTGLRAEQIRQELGMESKEMPRVLKEGLSKRMLRSRGQKRATTYFAK
jgi:hypothetical protein